YLTVAPHDPCFAYDRREVEVAHVTFAFDITQVIEGLQDLGSDVRVMQACELFDDEPPDVWVVCVMVKQQRQETVRRIALNMPVKLQRHFEPNFLNVDAEGDTMLVFPKLRGTKATRSLAMAIS